MPVMSSPERVPYAVAARELLRNTLLDAARDLLAQRSWADITMADIAAAAGVSRQTLYKEFGSREEFAQAFVLREAERFIVAVEQAVLEHRDDPARALSAAFDMFLTAAEHDPLIRAVLAADQGESLLPLVTTQGQPLVERAAERIVQVMLEGWPHVARADAELLAECLVRLAISYATLPAGPASMTAASITKLLGPFLERATSHGP
jgi:AcrR family transcriptional regulator